ncbi:SDR family NAD(P)-dependent oxidoreductase [Candidatus Woesearchaeota archaeon]|nr:SDR family NAD(P)-dependent oxidoreductase [Candidatus Woesearchaeota archaeon]
MVKQKVLVTGGAGFIGSFIVDELVRDGHAVRVFDSLEPQIHGPAGKIPDYLNKSEKVEFVRGDVLDYGAFREAVKDVDVVFHEAARVGVGQSMYEVSRYVDTNTNGTANLLNILANEKHSVKKVLVAASMSSYGEGAYTCSKCGPVSPELRSEKQMSQRKWELSCSGCGSILMPVPASESKLLQPTSVYAITKATQEDLVLCVCRAYGIPAVSLRYFNVYGPRQSLSNPYTGVAAIFMSRIKNGSPPIIFEDGMQSRDFVSVHDIAAANMLAMKSGAADYGIFNVGTGRPITIMAVAEAIARIYGKSIKPTVTNNYRKGDVRHCFADISRIKSRLGFEPKVSFEDGMRELISWADKASAVDMVDKATTELKSKGLVG